VFRNTGAAINANFITGLPGPFGIAVSGNNLFVGNDNGNTTTVGQYDATTGATINANFITGLNGTLYGLVVGQPTPATLYVSQLGDNTVGQYDATTGTLINPTSSRG
jgi:hypothetical protein